MHRGRGRLLDAPPGGPAETALPLVAQELTQAVEGPGVDHVVGGEPAALRRSDTEPQDVQVADGVRVGVDGEPHAGVPGSLDVIRGQVESAWAGVDLQRGAGRRAG